MVFLCLFGETGLHVNFSKSSSPFHKSFLSLISSSERSLAVVRIVKVLGILTQVGKTSSGRRHETLKC